MIAAPRKINVTDKELDRQTDGMLRWMSDVGRRAIIDGELLEGVTLSATGKLVAHKLGRLPTGYLVVKRDAPAVVYGASFDIQNMSLTATGDVTVSLWVF